MSHLAQTESLTQAHTQSHTQMLHTAFTRADVSKCSKTDKADKTDMHTSINAAMGTAIETEMDPGLLWCFLDFFWGVIYRVLRV